MKLSVVIRATFAATEYFATRNFIRMKLKNLYAKKKSPVIPSIQERVKKGIMNRPSIPHCRNFFLYLATVWIPPTFHLIRCLNH